MFNLIYRSLNTYVNNLGLDNFLRAVDYAVSAEFCRIVMGILLAILFYVFAILIGCVRWRLLLKLSGVEYPFIRTLRSWFIGEILGLFLPSSLGVDLYRLYDSTRYSKDFPRSFTVIVIEKIFHFVTMTIFVFLLLPVSFSTVKFYKITLLFTLLFLFACSWMLFSIFVYPWFPSIILTSTANTLIHRLILRFKTVFNAFQPLEYRNIGKLLIYSLMIQVCISLCYFWIGIATLGTSHWTTLLGKSLFVAGSKHIEIAIIKPETHNFDLIFLLGDEGTTKESDFEVLMWIVRKGFPFLVGFMFLFRNILRIVSPKGNSFREKEIGVPDSQLNNMDYKNETITRTYFTCFIMSILGASVSGVSIGLGEFFWVNHFVLKVEYMYVLFWMFIYFFIALVLGTLCTIGNLNWQLHLFGRILSPHLNYGLSFFFNSVTVGSIVVLWRYLNDVLNEKPSSYFVYIPVVMGYISLLLACTILILLVVLLLSKYSTKVAYLFLFIISVLPWIGGLAFAGNHFWTNNENSLKNKKRDAVSNLIGGNNIILIIADALRSDCLRLYNPNISVHTPNLERLSKEGILFLNCESQASWTKPSFGTMFTGLLPSKHGGVNKNAVLNPDAVTIAEELTKKGYFTKAFTNNPHLRSFFGFNKGFVEYYEYIPYKELFTASETIMLVWHYLRLGKIFGVETQIRSYYLPAKDITHKVTQWLQTGRPRQMPFFLLIHYMDPHYPYSNRETGRVYFQMPSKVPDYFASLLKESYLKEIEYLDTYIGVLLGELERQGLLENTYIIFTSDHGEEFNDHGGWWHGETLYREMLHVPLIIKPPNVLSNQENTGKVIKELVRLIDIPPTILKIAGVEIPENFEGNPLLSYDSDLTLHYENFSVAENELRNKKLRAIRIGGYKLILAEENYPRLLSLEELYDLEKDPYENNNVADDPYYESIKKVLLEKISSFSTHTETNIEKKEQAPAEIPLEVREQLKALGYMD